MGTLISKAFIDPEDLLGCVNTTGDVDCSFSNEDSGWGLISVLFLMGAYGFVLFTASNMLSSGSELLLLVPSISGLVGSVVLPVLGAVPDGAIMLFSGLGPDAQQQLTVGVGALAGSTIMLLTIPWALSIYYGSAPIGSDGRAAYSRRRELGAACDSNRGVSPDKCVRANALLMMSSSLIYLIIQGPAFQFATREEYLHDDRKHSDAAGDEHWYALVGFVVAVAAFVGYLVLMVLQDPSKDEKAYVADAVAIKAIAEPRSSVTLSGVIGPIISEAIRRGKLAAEAAATAAPIAPRRQNTTELLGLDGEAKKRLAALLKPHFLKYDANRDGKLQVAELSALLADLGELPHKADAAAWMDRLDPDRSGEIEQEEFIETMLTYIKAKVCEGEGEVSSSSSPSSRRASIQSAIASAAPGCDEATADAEDDDEEVEMPDDIRELSPAAQQRVIKRRAAVLCGVGTVLIVVFSDPMVDVMANLGARLGVPPFYVAFVLAPLASNASELIASLTYAAKKTQKTITVSLSALEGAACMNNTFCLAIFMALIYFRGLVWKFSAETLSIIVVQLVVGVVALMPTQRLVHAGLVLALYPLSILFVALMENVVGLD